MSHSARRQRLPRYGFAFLDETGTLASPRDPFFAVGLLRCAEPYQLSRPMQRIRDKQHFYDEIKWNKVSQKKLPLMIDLVNVFLSSDATFSAFIADKTRHDVIGRFGGSFKAYEALARQLVRGSVRRDEVLFVIADEYSTPPAETFEENVRDYVNQRLRRQAVAGVCRMRSSGSDLLQLIDLLLGAVVYEYKADRGVVSLGPYKPKVKLLEHIKRRAGVSSFVGGFRDPRLNVAEYAS
ncbi:MAG: DUF3800 domain-containing protein [Rhodospirillales bacterium]|nr:DUF3800 domain-containing protein [Rhodospirillales bacterium]